MLWSPGATTRESVCCNERYHMTQQRSHVLQLRPNAAKQTECPQAHLRSINLQQRRQEYTMEKTVFLASGVGKAGQLHVNQ